MQRTLAVELQRLSVQFRKQQKAYLNRIRSKDGGGGGAPGGSAASLALLEEQQAGAQQRGRWDDDYDPGFSDVQVSAAGGDTSRPLEGGWMGGGTGPGWCESLACWAGRGKQAGLLARKTRSGNAQRPGQSTRQ